MAAGSLLDDCRFALRVTGGNQRETLSKLTGRGAVESRKAVCLFITRGEEKSCSPGLGLKAQNTLLHPNKVSASVTPQS
jgi:hypothetical protein